MDGTLLQTAVAAPLVLALIVYTATQAERSPVQRTLALLLSMILAWMIGLTLIHRGSDSSFLLELLVIPASCFMSPLFLLLMLQYSRVEIFERRGAVRWALLAPFWLFLAGFFTNRFHGQMVNPSVFVRSDAMDGAGALFWAFQIWSNTVAIAGLAICLRTAWSSPSAAERRRMWLLCGGASFPLIAHLGHMFRVLPTDEPLTPASLALTSLFIVAAIRRYKLLDVQPIARRDVLEASSDGVLLADADEVVVDVNPAACRLLERPSRELCGSDLEAVLRAFGGQEFEGALEASLRVLRSGASPERVEIDLRDGRVLELSGGQATDGSGGQVGCFVVLRDRSGERRAERLLHQRQKLESVGILAAGIAHEVNNPLAYVRANIEHLRHVTDLLADEVDDLPKEIAGEVRDLPDVIDESIVGIERIERIVQGLVRFSRMPSTRRTGCDANEVVSEASRFASLDRSAAVRLEMDLADDLPQLHASPDQLVQVVLNLFLNARHALKERDDGCIRATTRQHGRWIEIRVADDGPGVPEAVRDKIFDPFFTTREPGEGTGLGLAIAYDIIREHDGSLELESPPEGGACFVVRLPIA